MANWDVTVDEAKQRVYLKLGSGLTVEEQAAASDACIEAAKRLDDGFDLVNDMRTFEPTSEEALEEVERGKRGLAENGMGAAVRVVAESTVTQLQFDRAGEDVEEYELAKAESVEAAEKLLDKRREQASQ
ncbi:hypothetical protein [Halorientalis halophila]|uniref:hypothetical protein n=1 Tax=Halorientalis halophila TaxID=3108499 RepID=UPI003008441D